jgi:HD-GYP domain-containing protein (c-di-GMP phosphodiesterase class II)
MSETQVLLTRIAALRQQLEQAKGLTTIRPAASGGPQPPDVAGGQGVDEGAFERLVADGSKQNVALDRTLRQLMPVPAVQDSAIKPRQLTARARRILEEGRELLGELRRLANAFELESSDEHADNERNDPLSRRYWETAAMAHTALRMLAAFPDAASAQLSLCEGLESILGVVAERIAEITAVLEQRRRETDQVETLARLLRALYAKEPIDLEAFLSLAKAILDEAQQAAPLRFLSCDDAWRALARDEARGMKDEGGKAFFDSSLIPHPLCPPSQGGDGGVFAPRPSASTWPARFVACHSLTVAQVIARIVRHDPDFRNDLLKPVLAALLHDAGMLGVPPMILSQATPLDDTQRRLVEAHTRLGAELVARLAPSQVEAGGVSWLADAAIGHHERLDGTGYPAGRQEAQLEPLTRLIAVCDVYAALCTARPHRPARDTRTALTDTLLLAEQGLLDRYLAERLLQLSFYPVGSLVELTDGALGVVVATHMGRPDLASLARPVLALLTDNQGKRLPVPRHLDLAESEDRSILRAVPK